MQHGEMPLDAFGWAIVVVSLIIGAFTVYCSIEEEVPNGRPPAVETRDGGLGEVRS